MARENPTFRDSLPMQYGIPILFMAACALGLFFLGDQPSLIVMKTAAVPLYFIASRGVGAIFTSAASRTPWTPVYLEHQFIESLIFRLLVDDLPVAPGYFGDADRCDFPARNSRHDPCQGAARRAQL